MNPHRGGMIHSNQSNMAALHQALNGRIPESPDAENGVCFAGGESLVGLAVGFADEAEISFTETKMRCNPEKGLKLPPRYVQVRWSGPGERKSPGLANHDG